MKADRRVLDFLRPELPPEAPAPAKVLELPKPKRKPPEIVPQTSAAFERAWQAYAQIDAFRRSTRRMSWPRWQAVAKVIGEEQLERAVVRFTKDPTQRAQMAKCGAPGFQVWLNQGRYEHYLAEPQTPASEAPGVTASDPALEPILRAVAYRGAGYAASYLAGARMSESRPGSLVVRTGVACDRLYDDCRAELAAAGVKVIVAVRDGRVLARHDL